VKAQINFSTIEIGHSRCGSPLHNRRLAPKEHHAHSAVLNKNCARAAEAIKRGEFSEHMVIFSAVDVERFLI
jgi:hypothetical protein